MASKLKIKGPQISALTKEFIKVTPGAKGSLHDGILKLRNELSSVVIKVSKNKLASSIPSNHLT